MDLVFCFAIGLSRFEEGSIAGEVAGRPGGQCGTDQPARFTN
jgi:hypothetical protein